MPYVYERVTVLARGVIAHARNITNPSLPSSPWTHYRPEIASTVFRLRNTADPSEREVDACGTHEVGYCALAFFLLHKAAVSSVVHFTALRAGMYGYQTNKELRSKFICGTGC
jgi:hypothetical protein